MAETDYILKDSSLGSRAQSGWTAALISPSAALSSPEQVGMILKDSALASRGVEANALNTAPPEVKEQIKASTTAEGKPTLAGSSAIGWLNYVSQNPVSADQLVAKPGATTDKKLESRTSLINPMAGLTKTDMQVSAFSGNTNIPTEIANQISSLNANQSMRRALQSELVNRLFQGAQSGDAYSAEALRAAVVQPGASAAFGSRILTPYESIANSLAATSSANLMSSQAGQISAAQRASAKLAEAQQRRAQLGSPPMGGYTGSEQERLDNQIMALRRAASSESDVQKRGVAASGASSGWVASPIW